MHALVPAQPVYALCQVMAAGVPAGIPHIPAFNQPGKQWRGKQRVGGACIGKCMGSLWGACTYSFSIKAMASPQPFCHAPGSDGLELAD